MLEYSNAADEFMVKSNVDLSVYALQAEVSKTLANPVRLAILHALRDGEKTVSELVDLVGVGQSNISQHLALMRHKQIVTTRRSGTSVYYRVVSPKISAACDLVREVLLEQLSRKNELAKSYEK